MLMYLRVHSAVKHDSSSFCTRLNVSQPGLADSDFQPSDKSERQAMTQETYLTGITTTGTPHIGNYVGAIRPAVASSKDQSRKNFYFLADYHSLAKTEEPDRIHRSGLEVAATWLACGLDTENAYFYRQSDIPEIPELTWILNGVTAKGLMNRAHSYKAQVQANEERGSSSPDMRIVMALFNYPMLMAADILMFKATKSPLVAIRNNTWR